MENVDKAFSNEWMKFLLYLYIFDENESKRQIEINKTAYFF